MLKIKDFYKNIIKKYYYNILDTGSSEVQIILITIKINNLFFHISNNNNDKNAKKNYLKLNSKRLKLLKYLKRKKINIYKNIMKELEINIDMVKW
ncbi:30S ribosomal subunit protein S15 [Candidatus Nasuia deltocephalinicola str. NAS-ALF]|uniref:Small ribosomal subunit protein uS15 n=1 Tax=Candidatus Nasuia deltocephalinicola str. NAS-ALF TaxID=1343077 RepID=S5TE65_9PROT|nr:30S ribosomal subunit protein S15 [Candidatus Nasuia deltocephalinicola str. NAS-ALF]